MTTHVRPSPPSAKLAVRALLRREGYTVSRVIRIESPGDSLEIATEVLYLNSLRQPMRAYITIPEGKRVPIVWAIEGWDVD